jgi:hypothetical protein
MSKQLFTECKEKIADVWGRLDPPSKIGVDSSEISSEFEAVLSGLKFDVVDFSQGALATESLFSTATAEASCYYLGSYLLEAIRVLETNPDWFAVDLPTAYLHDFLNVESSSYRATYDRMVIFFNPPFRRSPPTRD